MEAGPIGIEQNRRPSHSTWGHIPCGCISSECLEKRQRPGHREGKSRREPWSCGGLTARIQGAPEPGRARSQGLAWAWEGEGFRARAQPRLGSPPSGFEPRRAASGHPAAGDGGDGEFEREAHCSGCANEQRVPRPQEQAARRPWRGGIGRPTSDELEANATSQKADLKGTPQGAGFPCSPA